jgi:hypothetical protein
MIEQRDLFGNKNSVVVVGKSEDALQSQKSETPRRD